MIKNEMKQSASPYVLFYCISGPYRTQGREKMVTIFKTRACGHSSTMDWQLLDQLFDDRANLLTLHR